MTINTELITQHDATHEPAAEALSYDELSSLDDETYLAISHDFGATYQALLKQGEATGEMVDNVRHTLDKYLQPIEGLGDAEVAATMIKGYRSSYNKLLRNHGVAEEYESIDPTDEELAHVTAVSRIAIGVPILFTDNNTALFRHDTATSFCSSALLMEDGLPPLVVVAANVKDRDQVTVHETSHAAWAVMKKAGMIPESGRVEHEPGVRSPIETARNEAVAMQIAGQGKIIHPNVIDSLQEERADSKLIDRYRESAYTFAKAMRGVQGIDQADTVLGFMRAQDWSEYFEHVERITRLAEAAPHVNPVAQIAVRTTAGTSGWTTV